MCSWRTQSAARIGRARAAVIYHHVVTFPNVRDEIFTERDGVNEVARLVNRARCLWRETTMHDVGIDGQIEYVHTNEATGRIVLVQIKTGVSYFNTQIGGAYRYYPEAKHVSYWESAPLPVILILRSPVTDATYWVDARDSLRSGHAYIDVPSVNRFDESGVLHALERSGPLPTERVDMTDLFADMVHSRSPSASLPIDFADLFIHGLTDLADSLFFDIGLVTDVARTKQALCNPDLGIGMGSPEYAHLFRFVSYIIAHDLARVDYDYFLRHWDRLEMLGRFLAPLTARGRELVQHISDLESEWREAAMTIDESLVLSSEEYSAVLNAWRINDLDPMFVLAPGIRVVQDKAFQGIYPFEIARRVPVVEAFKVWYDERRRAELAAPSP